MRYGHNSKSPCQDCKNRTVGCHGSCNDYSSYRAELERVKNLRNEAWDKERAFRSVLSSCTKGRLYGGL